jgi:hypothetical protein
MANDLVLNSIERIPKMQFFMAHTTQIRHVHLQMNLLMACTLPVPGAALRGKHIVNDKDFLQPATAQLRKLQSCDVMVTEYLASCCVA